MDEYKKVNRELIEKVQEMRIDLGIYRQELTKLRLCVLEEQQKRVDQKQRSSELVARYFYELLEEMSPGANILKLLGVDEERAKGKGDYHVNSRPKRRSHTDILQDLRRSSDSARRFSGVIAVSPTRRKSGSVSGPPSVESVELDEAEIEVESEQATLGAAISELQLIVEDEEEPLREHRSCKESSVEEEEEQQDEDNLTEEEITIENVSAVTEKSIEPRVDKRRNAKGFQPPTKHLRDVTNTSDERSPQPSSPHVIKRRGKPRSTTLSEEVVEGTIQDQRHGEQEESITVARCTRIGSSTFERMPEDASHSTIGDSTIGNFIDALSSTPFNFKSDSNTSENSPRRRSLRRSAQNNAHNSSPSACQSVATALQATNEVSDVAANSSRPRRKCAPSNLIEPKVGSKMRNESKDCKKGRQKGEKKRKK